MKERKMYLTMLVVGVLIALLGIGVTNATLIMGGIALAAAGSSCYETC